MPTYDYRCNACGHTLEVFHSISESPKRKCPSCGKAKLERQIGAGAGILFKGGGFYHTDYRSESYKKAAGAERSESSSQNEAGADGKSSGSSESKDKSGAKQPSAANPSGDASTANPADRKGHNASPAGGEPKASKPPKEGKASKSAAKKKSN